MTFDAAAFLADANPEWLGNVHQNPFRPATVERAVFEAKLHRVPYLEGEEKAQARRSPLSFGDRRLAHVHSGDRAR